MPLTWFITGCSSGFGSLFVEQLHAAGDNVIATGRNAKTKLTHLQKLGVAVLDLDIAAPMTTIEAKIQEAWGIYPGGIDVVVNNAGSILSGVVEEINQEDMEASLRTNFHGPLNITRAVLPKLREKGAGTLLYVGSQAGWHSDPSAAAYCAAKAALGAAIECLAKELAMLCPSIKVLMIEPGYFGTSVFTNIKHVEPHIPLYAGFNDAVRQYEAGLTGTEPGDASKGVAAMIELVKGTGVALGRTVPVRMPIGSDGWQRVKDKCADMVKTCEDWETVAKSTDRAVTQSTSR